MSIMCRSYYARIQKISPGKRKAGEHADDDKWRPNSSEGAPPARRGDVAKSSDKPVCACAVQIYDNALQFFPYFIAKFNTLYETFFNIQNLLSNFVFFYHEI